MHQVQKGSCFCGAVELVVTGVPAAIGFCHCSACRSWASAPVNKFSLWKPAKVKIVKGEDNIGVYHKTRNVYRKFCKICGGHLLTSHARKALVDVYTATLAERSESKIDPASAETVLRVEDDLPGTKGLPAPAGGIGAAFAG